METSSGRHAEAEGTVGWSDGESIVEYVQCTVLLCLKLTGQSLASNSRILQIIRLPGGMTQCLPTPSREIDPITYEKLFSSATAGLVANFGTFCR